MNWFSLIKCVVVIAIILVVYLVLMNTKLKDKFQEYPFVPLGFILIALCVIGLLARVVLKL